MAGGGKTRGGFNTVSKETRAWAMASGEMPHMFLLRVSRGEIIEQKELDPDTGEVKISYLQPDLDTRIDCAKAASPYFTPKLSNVDMFKDMTDAELFQLAKELAAESGLSFGDGGISQAQQSEECADSKTTGGTAAKRTRVRIEPR